MDCCICSKPIAPVGDWTQGNDAWPVADGRCCNQCDMTVVVQARLMEWAAERSKRISGNAKREATT
jgi:hypothetical protein